MPAWVGVYVNADDLQVMLAAGPVDLHAQYGLEADAQMPSRLSEFLGSSTLLIKANLTEVVQHVRLVGASLEVEAEHVNAYVAAVLPDFIRHELLAAGESFTFETVMSASEKIDFMQAAREAGYRTYLYFVATADPSINIERVQLRVLQGGHDVPHDKITARYFKSIGLLTPACATANRAYVFDNSGDEHQLIAEITEGEEMVLRTTEVPLWFTGTDLYLSFH